MQRAAKPAIAAVFAAAFAADGAAAAIVDDFTVGDFVRSGAGSFAVIEQTDLPGVPGGGRSITVASVGGYAVGVADGAFTFDADNLFPGDALVMMYDIRLGDELQVAAFGTESVAVWIDFLELSAGVSVLVEFGQSGTGASATGRIFALAADGPFSAGVKLSSFVAAPDFDFAEVDIVSLVFSGPNGVPDVPDLVIDAIRFVPGTGTGLMAGAVLVAAAAPRLKRR